MTKKELITHLSKYPDNLQIYVFDGADYDPNVAPAREPRLIDLSSPSRHWDEVPFEGLHDKYLQVFIPPKHG